MKQALLSLCVLSVLCGLVQAANKINAFAPGVTTAYSVVRESDEIIDRLKRVAPYP